ncbi:Acetyltransferase (GNAT) family protein [Actinacidiphila yanglinensis]|uniref:Acetyltransferase (GNAT) family protein n=1 Tax=Actinacidiphila yanglinensis TaxID=310779 RepID=A0A1H5XDH3_9ACTN|nr:GNAT family N-acetyltransferase [Actinacidiphila yanglinensis]SEG09246.1 Acetyltransferase (GNAT) family protein [Actinacidiphila yanglinensis]
MSDLVLRSLTAGESPLFTSLPASAEVGRALLGQDFATLDAGGEYRPEWSWVALRDGVVVARAAWWAKPGDAEPVALDWFDFADGEEAAAVELLRAAPLFAEYGIVLPSGWREHPAPRAAYEARAAAAEAAGMRKLVERYRYTWTAGEDPLPERTGRLVYRPEPDDGAFRAVMARIMTGTLDAHDRMNLDAHGLDTALDETLAVLDWMPSPNDWRRVAYTPQGEVVGVHIPARNPAMACIGFIAVVPEQRGRGYAYDLLVECTHDLVERGADRIAAATDQPNFPMARAFARAGYPITQERVDFV